MAKIYSLIIPVLALMLVTSCQAQEHDDKASKVAAKCLQEFIKDAVNIKSAEELCPLFKRLLKCILDGLPGTKISEEEAEKFEAMMKSKMEEEGIKCDIDVRKMINDHNNSGNAAPSTFSAPWWQTLAVAGGAAAMMFWREI